ncbi:unnamed protein product [Caenorhabditis auriculariae]|uniref:Uncharacterized protein n=1 Tax=Caenorhabditis auriculariae TaxID=2777116 RepID=A0A8S1GQA1_9PELO|nr:unnamed protein product [Caenorhabditis auriculariae]
MDTSTEYTDTTDHSVYGLVVFLVILVFFASLTTGLIICLLKIWCTFHHQRRESHVDQRERRSIPHGSPVFDSDSEDDSEQQASFSGRRFSQRLMSYVHKSLDKREKDSGKVEHAQVHEKSISMDTRRVPEINIDEHSTDSVQQFLTGLEGIPANRRPQMDEKRSSKCH